MEWNTANKLTMLRVILIPVYLVVWYLNMETSAYWALAVFVVASVTDFADGYVARHYNQVTTFGKFMDPLADKILVITAMIWFASVGMLPVWALVIVVAREFAVSGLRLIAVDNGRVIAAAWSGKVKTFSTMVCLCLMHLPIPEVLVHVCVWVIVITTVYSGIEYFWKNKDVMK
ncbi:CDP-diacylglycerol--glycerol-3-phosphate 3-phosphatidyltransferase [Pseudoflavonifractor sp. An85]|uniref:CDP-diacylglycerol--glycerol-3-phosphate 3-phosphatidyltransferase n=1 Tax=Pseudoflavonifractor sp. An85 TaxID=1965661 RepID=UPI000B388747|nr:CDP-diacylglycerol--glycerol-3-phosphate 3-phosphatidyltransferase [Pseudoflavonifractor sp. An85]OUN23026.1 CDP-diacylglycerol--glycerol-3-phosphate 3-phosphatidyltransferase [Pseudoflavonifractor sp. An85]